LVRRLPGDVRVPAKSTIHAVLDRHDLVATGRRRRQRANGTALLLGRPSQRFVGASTTRANSNWATPAIVYPLTVTDHASRFLLLCEAKESVKEELALPAFERLFRERGPASGHSF